MPQISQFYGMGGSASTGIVGKLGTHAPGSTAAQG